MASNPHADYVAYLEGEVKKAKERLDQAQAAKKAAQAAIEQAEKDEAEARDQGKRLFEHLAQVKKTKLPVTTAKKAATAAKSAKTPAKPKKAAKKAAQPKKAAKKAAQPKAPATATTAQPGEIDIRLKGGKAAFIRANPTMGVTALVKAAAEQGVKMSSALVYATRKDDKKKATKKPAKKAAAKTVKESKKAPVKKAAAKAKAPAKKKAVKKPAKKAAAPSTTDDRGAKSAFIRSLPSDTPVSKVMELAEKNGTPVSKALVYAVRKDKKAAPTKKALVKKAPAKPKKKASKAAVKEKAAEGRRAVARGERPPMRLGMAIVMGDKTMNAQQVVDGLNKKGWAPESDDPKGYVSYMLSSNRDTFERDESKGRGYYRVRSDVDASWTPGTPAASGSAPKAKATKPKAAPKAKAPKPKAAPKAKAPKPDASATPAPKANGKSNGKSNGSAAPKPLDDQEESKLDELISPEAATTGNPFV
jgi:colicin import membrane protein